MAKSADDLQLTALRAVPDDDALGAVVVVPPGPGLDDEVLRLARRIAGEGYAVLVPDVFDCLTADAREALTAGPALDPDVAMTLFPAVREATQVVKAAVDQALTAAGDDAKVAIVGAGAGGVLAYQAAAADRRVRLVLACDAVPHDMESVEDIAGSAVAFHGEDPAVADYMPELRAAMRRAGVPYASRMYPRVERAGEADQADVQQDMLLRTLALLRLHLT